MKNDIKVLRNGKKVLTGLERVTEYGKRRVLTPLNNTFGYDFNKPFTVFYNNGSWTVNGILKAVEDKGYAPKNSKIVLIMVFKGDKGYLSGRVYGVEMTFGGYNHDIHFYGGKSDSLIDNCWRKGDIEKYRKSDIFECYIICQKYDDLGRTYKHPDEHNTDLSQRFYVNNTHYGALELQTIDGGQTLNFYRYKGDSKEGAIDKSGYIVQLKRDTLQRNAEKLRDERKKTAYTATDNGAIIAELEKRIELLKAVLLEEFKQAKTAKQYETFTDRIRFFGGFTYLVGQFERLKEREKEKNYRSIDDFNDAVKEINSYIDKLFIRG